MKQNSLMVSLISLKEKTNKLFQDHGRIVVPVLRGLLAFALLTIILSMFPYGFVGNKIYVLAILAVIQAFLPMSFLYYIVSILILYNLWQISFDIFGAFVLFIIICAIGYFRIDGHYSYLTILVPVLIYLKLEVVIPAVLAIAFGLEALFPAMAGVVLFYFCASIKAASTLVESAESTSVGIGLKYILGDMVANQTFLIMLFCVFAGIILTCAVRHLFHERAWTIACVVGNLFTAFVILAGRILFEIDIPEWRVLLEVFAGILICMAIEFFHGIGDVSRIEKVVFEDEEYIYYVKAVPKIKVAQSDPNVKIMNDSIREDTNDMTEEAVLSEEERRNDISGADAAMDVIDSEESEENEEKEIIEKETEKEIEEIVEINETAKEISSEDEKA